jgi:DNA-binding MarR family transcriptional regulator
MTTSPRAAAALEHVAERLHSASIHLLRRLRRQDDASGLSAPHLSALSVLVFRGPCTLGELAEAEQVKPPSITRIIANLEKDGLVERAADASDRRVVRVAATGRGREVLLEGRRRRLEDLTARLRPLDAASLATLQRAAELIEQVLRD